MQQALEHAPLAATARASAAAADPHLEDTLGFFGGLLLIVPLGIALWAAIIWGVLQLVG